MGRYGFKDSKLILQHQNCMISSKVMPILNFFLFYFFFYLEPVYWVVPKNTKIWLKSVQKCRKVSYRPDFIVLVLLSAHAKRVGVSRMRELLNLLTLWNYNKGLLFEQKIYIFLSSLYIIVYLLDLIGFGPKYRLIFLYKITQL